MLNLTFRDNNKILGFIYGNKNILDTEKLSVFTFLAVITIAIMGTFISKTSFQIAFASHSFELSTRKHYS